MEIHPTEMSREEIDDDIQIQRLTLEIREGTQKAKSLSSACIYMVPRELRKLNESAYTPRLITIGPLHRNDEHLQTPMQHVKMSYTNDLLCRMTQGMENPEAKQKKILQECVAEMKMSIEDAKKCYAEEVTLDVEMMLVDGCFILEFLYKLYLLIWKIGYYPLGADPIFANRSTRITVQHDLVLLENQIPFLVLERLFPLTLARIPNNLLRNFSLTDYVVLPQVKYLMHPVCKQSTNSTGSAKTSCWPRDCVLWPSGNKMNNSKPEEEVSSRNDNCYYHILHKLHHDYLPHHQTGMGKLHIMPSASELVYAGIKFVPGTEKDMFKVKFTEPEGPFWWCRSARFEIPCLTIDELMEPFLRNFIAFEQCRPGISQHFTSYEALMDMLVNSDEDVQVLEKAGVISNGMSARKDITDLFNNLSKETSMGDFLFADSCNRATGYSKRFWPKNMAYLRSQYFASPWKFIAFCLGFVYFGLTIAQLIVAIIK